MVKRSDSITGGVLFQLFFFMIFIPLSPLLLSRRWDWWEAWVFALIWTGGFLTSRVLASRKHPDLLKERSRFMGYQDTKPWDRILAPLIGYGCGMVPLAAGLEAWWGHPPDFSLALELPAMLLLLAGYFWSSWALVENRFFSGVVRIQYDRGHRVIDEGPYRWVRHPGYSGALVSFLAMPVFLDSFWALLPSLFLVAVLVIRTALEDRVLKDELEGYREYSSRVRYRLLPGIW